LIHGGAGSTGTLQQQGVELSAPRLKSAPWWFCFGVLAERHPAWRRLSVTLVFPPHPVAFVPNEGRRKNLFQHAQSLE
jgi:hypothetical protein